MISIYGTCWRCGGSGFYPDYEEQVCPVCRGTKQTVLFSADLSLIEEKLDQILSALPSVCKHPGGGDFG